MPNSLIVYSIRLLILRFWYFCTFILTVAILSNLIISVYCLSSNQNEIDGWTSPTGEIILRTGRALELICTINPRSALAGPLNSKYLAFVKDDDLIENQFVTEINETAIRLYQMNQEESKHVYYCYVTAQDRSTILPSMKHISNSTNTTSSQNSSIGGLDGSIPKESNFLKALIGKTVVTVSQKGNDVDYITCISINWVKLKCTWDVPHNFVLTNYTIRYTPEHGKEEYSKCPNNDDIERHFCEWTLTTIPPYKREHERLKIMIVSINMFGSKVQSISFRPFKHIIPNKPADLQPLSSTSTSIVLQWNIGELYMFPGKWTYMISYFRDSEQAVNFTCDSSMVIKKFNEIACNVTNLAPKSLYTFRVYMKSAVATSAKYWSKASDEVTFATKGCPFSRSPKIDIGSFRIANVFSNNSTRMVYLYWEPIGYLHCSSDDILTYKVDMFTIDEPEGNRDAVNYVEHEWSWQPAHYEIGFSGYEFEITAVNSVGSAPNKSLIYVPAVKYEVKSCSLFYKIIIGVQSYELVWEPPANESDIVDYTLFTCQNSVRHREICYHLQWIHVLAHITKYKLFVNSSWSLAYQFAISVNKQTSSSGMLWDMGTVWQKPKELLEYVQSAQDRPHGLNKEINSIVSTSTMKNDSLAQKRVHLEWRMSENRYQNFLRKLLKPQVIENG